MNEIRFWTDDEPGWREAMQELARIRRRVKARLGLTIFLTLLLTAGVVFRQSRKKRVYQATVVLRVTEGSFDPQSAPPTTAKLQDYLWDVAFSRKHLEQLILKHKLYQSLYHIDPNLAVEEFRDVLDIKVIRNYFAKERYPDDPPRSARLAISYAGPTPHKALVVCRELAHLAEKQEESSRQYASETAARSVAQSTTSLKQQLASARRQLAELRARFPRASEKEQAMILVRAQSLREEIESLRDQLEFVGSRKTQYELRKGLEERDLGLRFEVVDPGREPKVILTDMARTAMVGFIALIFLFPVVGVGIGAYDLRVYDIEDIRRLGLEPFGHIPAFDGYRLGSWLDRRKAH